MYGLSAALLRVVHELGYHGSPQAGALARAGAALLAGVVLGLWLPRGLILHRMRTQADRRGSTAPLDPRHRPGARQPEEAEAAFAASLVGLLLMAVGLSVSLLCLLGPGAESYRGWLLRSFVHPQELRPWLLWLPACGALVLTGTVGTAALVALHGWYRMATAPSTSITGLWAVMLLAAMLAATLTARSGASSAVLLSSVVAIFLAGGLCVLRKPGPHIWPVARWRERPAVDSDVLGLIAASVSALGLGGALAIDRPASPVSLQHMAGAGAVLLTAGTLGLFLGRGVLRLGPGKYSTLLAAILVAAAWTLPYHALPVPPQSVGSVRLACVVIGTSIGIVLVGRRISLASHSVQSAMSTVGTYLAIGLGVGLLAGTEPLSWLNGSVLAELVGLMATATGGLWLILNRHIGRSALLAGAGAVSFLLILAACFPPPMQQTVVAESNPIYGAESRPAAVRAARALLAAEAVAFATTTPNSVPNGAEEIDAWSIDLGGPRLDTLVLHAPPPRAALLTAPDAQRLLRRAAAALVPGGRLVLELPTDAALEAALPSTPLAGGSSAASVYLLKIDGRAAEYNALVLGRDVPAWARQLQPPAGFAVTLHPAERWGPSRAALADATMADPGRSPAGRGPGE